MNSEKILEQIKELRDNALIDLGRAKEKGKDIHYVNGKIQSLEEVLEIFEPGKWLV